MSTLPPSPRVIPALRNIPRTITIPADPVLDQLTNLVDELRRVGAFDEHNPALYEYTIFKKYDGLIPESFTHMDEVMDRARLIRHWQKRLVFVGLVQAYPDQFTESYVWSFSNYSDPGHVYNIVAWYNKIPLVVGGYIDLKDAEAMDVKKKVYVLKQ